MFALACVFGSGCLLPHATAMGTIAAMPRTATDQARTLRIWFITKSLLATARRYLQFQRECETTLTPVGRGQGAGESVRWVEGRSLPDELEREARLLGAAHRREAPASHVVLDALGHRGLVARCRHTLRAAVGPDGQRDAHVHRRLR